jgi:hypothetical protein
MWLQDVKSLLRCVGYRGEIVAYMTEGMTR